MVARALIQNEEEEGATIKISIVVFQRPHKIVMVTGPVKCKGKNNYSLYLTDLFCGLISLIQFYMKCIFPILFTD